MFLEGRGPDNNIIQIRKTVCRSQFTECQIHQSGKTSWPTRESKRHNPPLELSTMGRECCFGSVLFFYLHLPIPRRQIQTGKPLATTQRFQDTIGPRSRYCIFRCTQIQFAVINAHTVTSIMSPYQNKQTAPGDLRLFNSTIRQRLVQLLMYDLLPVRQYATRQLLNGSMLTPVLMLCAIRFNYPKSELLIPNMPSYWSISGENWLFYPSESPSELGLITFAFYSLFLYFTAYHL